MTKDHRSVGNRKDGKTKVWNPGSEDDDENGQTGEDGFPSQNSGENTSPDWANSRASATRVRVDNRDKKVKRGKGRLSVVRR